MIARLSRLWHTLRYLRPVQLYGRFWFRLARPRPDLRPAPARRALTGQWTPPVPSAVSLLGPDTLRLLNTTHSLSDHGWDSPALEKLWRYNLHYFDDLTAPPSPERLAWQRDLIERWIRENPVALGTGWDPYPTSLRIVNWIKWLLAGNDPPRDMLASLAVQARWLRRRLEVHLLGNHLFANAKALVFAGMLFEGPEAEGWMRCGMDILAREMTEQFLADGGHFERSPMYHAILLGDVLDLLNIARTGAGALPSGWRTTVTEWRGRVDAMRHWFGAMTHPDGDVAFFNDAAFGIAPSRQSLEGYAQRLGLGGATAVSAPVTTLSASGYIRVELADAVALLDVAPVGPDYLPAHAHADTLSFELSLGGQRVIVNSGTSRYGADAERLRQRGTGAHNTVMVDDENSSEVWGGFRVARRARPSVPVVRVGPPIVVECSHDGYQRLPGRVGHTRAWELDAASMRVTDRLTGEWTRAQARYHLHPRVAVGAVTRGPVGPSVVLELHGGRRARFEVLHGELEVAATSWHPSFGVEEPNACLVVTLRDDRAEVRLSWDAGA